MPFSSSQLYYSTSQASSLPPGVKDPWCLLSSPTVRTFAPSIFCFIDFYSNNFLVACLRLCLRRASLPLYSLFLQFASWSNPGIHASCYTEHIVCASRIPNNNVPLFHFWRMCWMELFATSRNPFLKYNSPHCVEADVMLAGKFDWKNCSLLPQN